MLYETEEAKRKNWGTDKVCFDWMLECWNDRPNSFIPREKERKVLKIMPKYTCKAWQCVCAVFALQILTFSRELKLTFKFDEKYNFSYRIRSIWFPSLSATCFYFDLFIISCAIFELWAKRKHMNISLNSHPFDGTNCTLYMTFCLINLMFWNELNSN